VNAVALSCLEEALADRAFVSEHVAQIKRGRERLAQLFDELGLRFWPSQTNFVLVRVGETARKFVESMQRRGVLVRDFIGQSRLRRMCPDHRWDAPTDEWSCCRQFARRSRRPDADHGEPGVPPGRHTAAILYGRARRPSLHYCMTGANMAHTQATYPHDHDSAPDPLQHLHDLRLVWPSEVSPCTAVQGHRHQLVIAFAEYCFQVPANRIGSYEFTTAQLKTIQEVITLTVFSIFSVLYLREPLKWNYLVVSP